jgi:hypothetical protein
VGAKTNEVIEYDHDETRPGKPLHILIPGGLVALAALGVIILVAYLTWFQGQIEQNTGIVLVAILFPFYVGGVFLFSYGYELYNVPRAIRLTVIIVFLTVAAVVIVAVLFFVLAGGGKLPGGDKKKSSGGGSKVKADVSPSIPSTSRSGSNLGPVVFMPGLGGTRTHTREIVTEKKVEVPVAPRAIDCPYCRRSYVPAEQDYACPACGAATPKELIEESQAPREEK